ncbi:MAG: arylsulfatase [Opitutaceae bacterium]|nr:arylsulfatase [Opitutaceae bacterium]
MKPAFRFFAALILAAASCFAADPRGSRPNIIFLLADDLGYGDIGPFGQKIIRTPNLDQLARDGMKFTQHYSGHNVCAPSRCVLMTSLHPGHAYIRNNRGGVGQGSGGGGEGQEPVPPGELKLPLTLKKLGYTTGAFGKWGLGAVGSTGDPNKQGIDRFFGYNDQAVAHNFYPTYLWDNYRRVTLKNPAFSAHQKLPEGADPNDPKSYATFTGNEYAPDLINEQARRFLRENKDRPFFLYYPTTVPHLALQVPVDSLAEYEGKLPDEPYPGGKGYLPHRTPHAAYAAMITRLDREIGRLLAMVDEFGLREKTIVVFTSDNGPLWERFGGTDSAFFNSTGGLRGQKGGYYEAGVRVPCIVRWTGRVRAGSVNDRVTGFEDWLPTFLELIGAKDVTPKGIDGISFAPTLLGQKQPERPFLYRESQAYGGQQYLRVGNWKAFRTNLNPPGARGKSVPVPPIELYDLASDPKEARNVAAEHPDIVAKMERIMKEQHLPSKLWVIPALDGPVAEQGVAVPNATKKKQKGE